MDVGDMPDGNLSISITCTDTGCEEGEKCLNHGTRQVKVGNKVLVYNWCLCIAVDDDDDDDDDDPFGGGGESSPAAEPTDDDWIRRHDRALDIRLGRIATTSAEAWAMYQEEPDAHIRDHLLQVVDDEIVYGLAIRSEFEGDVAEHARALLALSTSRQHFVHELFEERLTSPHRDVRVAAAHGLFRSGLGHASVSARAEIHRLAREEPDRSARGLFRLFASRMEIR